LDEEIATAVHFTCHHGITPENLTDFLVEPYPVTVDPDDLETGPREMWIVLKERPLTDDGYVVIYDPMNGGWGVAEKTDKEAHVLVIGADSLAEALEGM
jgi:hypothetical protein